MVELRTWQGKFYEGSNFNLLARVVGVDGVALTQEDFLPPDSAPIALRIYESTDAGGSTVYSNTFTRNEEQFSSGGATVPTISSTLLTGYGWPDSVGFNMAINVKTSAWDVGAVGGQLYRAEAELTTNDAATGVVYVVWNVRCLPIRS